MADENLLLKWLRDAQEMKGVGQNALTALTRGLIPGTLGAPVDLANLGINAAKAAYGYAGQKAGLLSPEQMPNWEDKPIGGSEWMGEKMQKAGLLSDYRNPLAEGISGGLLGPLGAAAAANRAPQIARGLLQMGENASTPSKMANQGQRGMASIVFRKGEWKDRSSVLPDGTVEFPLPSRAYAPLGEYRDKAFDLVSEKYSPAYDGFFRFTNNAAEPSLVAGGQMRNSMNHIDGFSERGVSVANGAHYGAQGYKHGYRVDGKIIGYGSDGEPLLDPKTMRVISGIQPADEIVAADHIAQKKILANAGLPSDYLTNFKFLNKAEDLWR